MCHEVVVDTGVANPRTSDELFLDIFDFAFALIAVAISGKVVFD